MRSSHNDSIVPKRYIAWVGKIVQKVSRAHGATLLEEIKNFATLVLRRGSSVVERIPEEDGVGGSIPPRGIINKKPRSCGVFCLFIFHAQFFHPIFIKLGKAYGQKSIFECCLGVVHINFARKQYGSRKAAPIEFLIKIVVI